MTPALSLAAGSVPDAALVEALSASLAGGRASGPRVVSLGRRPSPYRTSFALEEVDADLDDGSTLRLILKDVRPDALHDTARSAKPRFLRAPHREIEIYRSLSLAERPGTARLFGARADESRGEFWLLLEHVPAVELYQRGDTAAWEAAARWLASFHARLAGDPRRLRMLESRADLVHHGPALSRLWLERARRFARDGAAKADLDHLARRYDAVIERLSRLPATLLHGEFYASNLLVAEGTDGTWRVCPVDWEMAGLGPGLIDLAALVSGDWREDERAAIAHAYLEEWNRTPMSPLSNEVFRTGLACCGIHVALQWLGWSAGWAPPREHAHDWLAVATRLAGEAGL